MNLRIADMFTYSLTKLTNEKQKAVKTTAFDRPPSSHISVKVTDHLGDEVMQVFRAE